jgi:hypothetical protein
MVRKVKDNFRAHGSWCFVFNRLVSQVCQGPFSGYCQIAQGDLQLKNGSPAAFGAIGKFLKPLQSYMVLEAVPERSERHPALRPDGATGHRFQGTAMNQQML